MVRMAHLRAVKTKQASTPHLFSRLLGLPVNVQQLESLGSSLQASQRDQHALTHADTQNNSKGKESCYQMRHIHRECGARHEVQET